jgi:hypothetical protein
MQVDDPADNNGNPSTPTRPTPPSTQSTICISEQTIQEMCEDLERIIRPGDNDARIRRFLGNIWFTVRHALQEDPNLKARLASEDQFKENVKQNDEQQFVNLLRDIAKKESWRDLLQNGTSFLYFDLKCSDRVLSPDVFLNKDFVDSAQPQWRLSSASEIGARLSLRSLYISFIVSDHSLCKCMAFHFPRRRGKRTY